MPITAGAVAAPTLTTDKASYTVGETITASYTLDPASIAPRTVTVSGTLTLDGQTVTVPPVDVKVEHVVAYTTPTAEGLTFSPVAGKPGVFTATAK